MSGVSLMFSSKHGLAESFMRLYYTSFTYACYYFIYSFCLNLDKKLQLLWPINIQWPFYVASVSSVIEMDIAYNNNTQNNKFACWPNKVVY